MNLRISPLEYARASFRRGPDLTRLNTGQTAIADRVMLQFKKPPDSPTYRPNPRGGYIGVNNARRGQEQPARYTTYIATYGDMVDIELDDLRTGVRITVDTTELTLKNDKKLTQEELLKQLADEINTQVPKVSAGWLQDIEQFEIKKTGGGQLDVSAGTSGSNKSQNTSLLSMIQQGHTSSISTSPTYGDYSQSGRISIDSKWPEGEVIINDVTIQSAGTDTFSGRVDAINNASSETGVVATGQAARLEVPFGFFEHQNAQSFNNQSIRVNGVEVTLPTFDPGNRAQDVLIALNNEITPHLSQALRGLRSYVSDDSLVIEAEDITYGITLSRGSSTETALLDGLGGPQVATPSIELTSEDPISLKSPYGAASPSQDLSNNTNREAQGTAAYHFQEPATSRLYLSGGLLEKERPKTRTGQARRVEIDGVTLAKTNGSIFNFDHVTNWDDFNEAAFEAIQRQRERLQKKADQDSQEPTQPWVTYALAAQAYLHRSQELQPKSKKSYS